MKEVKTLHEILQETPIRIIKKREFDPYALDKLFKELELRNLQNPKKTNPCAQ